MVFIPLATLFGKAEAADVKVSPGGKHIAWMARGDGVLNLWLAPLERRSGAMRSRSQCKTAEKIRSGVLEGTNIPGARQLTAVPDQRDVCFAYRFTHDEKRIVYLRETKQGSEMYHLFSLDLDASGPVASGRDMLVDHPHLTCSVGFVGGLQLWLPTAEPNMVILSTGKGSLLWDLSSLDLDTGELKTLFSNPASSKMGLVKLALKGLLHLVVWLCSAVVHVMTLSLVQLPVTTIAPAPEAPLQYFVDSRKKKQQQQQSDEYLIGCAQCSLSVGGIAMRFSQRFQSAASHWEWESVGPEIPFADLNMQLVGSGAATGTLRFDRSASGSVAIHTCDVADTNTSAYVEYSAECPRGRVLAHSAAADISEFVANPVTGEVEAVVVVTDHSELLPVGRSGERFQQAVKQIAMALGRSAKSDILTVTSRTASDDIWIICVSSDAEPAMYYIVHSPYAAAASPSLLLASRPQLAAHTLADATAVIIPARDGLSLPGYLTLPLPSSFSFSSAAPQQKELLLPLVLVLHGGPSARDYPGYNPLVQLLASRGMAVLSVDYRGSAGYGMSFLRKGSGAVQEMHNDVEDARLWAIKTKVADPTRIAILGGSWGGYLALGGATSLTPSPPCQPEDTQRLPPPHRCHHRYAAVVAIVPLVTVGKANTSASFRGDPLVARYWRQIYGAEVSDSLLAAEALSPMFHSERLQGTGGLLLVHGEDDPRVPREHGDCVAAEARRLEVPGAYVTYSREGHSIRREANVLHLWHLVEKFLCASLQLPAPPPELTSEDAEKLRTANHTATVHWSSHPGLDKLSSET